MSYAQARLWLGITGVGTLVVVALAFILSGAPHRIFPTNYLFRFSDVLHLAAFFIVFALIMSPLDLLGGWIVPRMFQRQEMSLKRYTTQWLRAALAHGMTFFVMSLAILSVGRIFGLLGALALVLFVACSLLAAQSVFARLIAYRLQSFPQALPRRVTESLLEWGYCPKRTIVVDHTDPGFTGGIGGWPGNESLVIPRRWLDLKPQQLGSLVARRVAAIQSGSHRRGIFVALVWILSSFYLSSLLPGAGVRNVAELITLYSGFTLWSFFGLLTLPTLSRSASLAIDRDVIDRGVARQSLESALALLDLWQDDQPQRSPLVETIFHPVPSLKNRLSTPRFPIIGAWHAARTMLFLSWACAGLLSRAVHCNVGRPELWVMLPTD